MVTIRSIRSFRTYRTLALFALLSTLLISQSGCLLLAVGAGAGATVAYVKGDTEILLDGNPKQIAYATEKAVKDLDLTLISNTSSNVDAKVVARTASDVKYTIVAKAEGDKVSHVSIRVGVFGDDAMQSQILEKIKAHLPEAVAANPVTPATQPSKSTDDSQSADAGE